MKPNFRFIFILTLILISLSGFVMGQQVEQQRFLPTSPPNFDANYTDTLLIGFTKYKSEQAPDSTYFNILKIKNYFGYPISGKLKLNLPLSWSILIPPPTEVEIGANDSLMLPLMFTMPKSVVGGVANVINAALYVDRKKYQGNAYALPPRIRNWYFEVEKQELVFNDYIETIENSIYIKNGGNAPELIKLSFETGMLLNIEEFPNAEYDLYINLPQKTDTTIYFNVKRANVSSNVKNIYKDNVKASSIKILSSTDDKQKSTFIYTKELESDYDGTDFKLQAPLNVELNINNIMGNGAPNTTSQIFGGIYFNQDQEINYSFMLRNIGPNQIQNFNPITSLYGRVNYRNNFMRLSAGDGVGLPLIHSARGFGLSGSIDLANNLRLDAAVATHRNQNVQSASARLQTRVTKYIPLIFGATVEQNTNLGLSTASLQAGSSISLLKNVFTANVAVSQFSLAANPFFNLNTDTNYFGFSYNLNHTFTFKKFKTRTSVRDYTNNFINASASRAINHRSEYIFKNRNTVLFQYRSNNLNENNGVFGAIYGRDGSRYQNLYNLYYTFSMKDGGVLALGPQYSTFGAELYNQTDTIQYISDSRFLGASANYRKRIGNFKSIGASSYIGATEFYILDNTLNNRSRTVSYRFTGNYYSRDWRLSLIYNYGPFNQSPYVTLLNYTNTTFQSLGIRPYYEAKFWDDRILVNAQLLYTLFLPNNQELLSGNIRVIADLEKGWQLFGSGTYYSSSRPDEERGTQSFKSIGINIGLRKAFGIQQPRIKYHDLKIVCFHDLNGNGSLDDNELRLTNIVVKVKADNNALKAKKTTFIEQSLITNNQGTVELEDIPESMYDLEFTSLENLGKLYNVLGNNQRILVNENTTLYIPFAESYKVKGKVVLIRDKMSALGKVEIGNIRITAESPGGYTYSILTSSDGTFQIDVPQAGFYKISINDVLGPNFELEDNDFIVDFNGFKSFDVNFVYRERARAFNMDGGFDPSLFQSLFGADEGSSDFPITAEDLVDPNNEEQLERLKSAIAEGDVDEIYRVVDEMIDAKLARYNLQNGTGGSGGPNTGNGNPSNGGSGTGEAGSGATGNGNQAGQTTPNNSTGTGGGEAGAGAGNATGNNANETGGPGSVNVQPISNADALQDAMNGLNNFLNPAQLQQLDSIIQELVKRREQTEGLDIDTLKSN